MAMALPGRWALAGLAAEPERVRVRPSGSAQTEGIKFVFFSEIFFSAKTISGNAQKMFRGTKNTQEITKILGKIPRDRLGHEQSK
jgi:hypothetical protein